MYLSRTGRERLAPELGQATRGRDHEGEGESARDVALGRATGCFAVGGWDARRRGFIAGSSRRRGRMDLE